MPKHHNLMGMDNGGNPMGNNLARAVRQVFLQGGLDARLGFGVQGAGAVIEQENGRVHDKCAGQGQALPLAARDPFLFLPG
jgi:hypothetical protein